MSYSKATAALLLCWLALAASVAGQSSQPANVAGAPRAKADAAPPAGALAIVNGQSLTLADIDPKVRAMVEGLGEQIVAARRAVLDNRINSLLLTAEAKRRGITSQQLYETEVTKRINAPGEEEVKAVYEANRSQMGDADLASVRPQIVAYLRNKQEQALYAQLTARLRATNTVTMGKDVNAQNLAPGETLATVAGQSITAAMLSEQLKPVIYKLRMNVYEAEKSTLDRTVNDLLLMAEAKQRNVGPEEIMRAEITDKIRHPTDADVTKFYEENKARIKGDLAANRANIVAYLDQQEQERLSLALVESLRAKANIRFLIAEPEAPALTISNGNGPSRGDVNAPVTVVEFTDFQCPACAAMHPVLEEVLKFYGNRVRFVIRHFPLTMHANARKAAEAASAAHAQGKFFEYIAVLFQHQDALDIASLKKYAAELGLDRARFDAALDKGVYAAEVQRDITDGESYGIEGTPTIFINGVALRELSADGLRAAIKRALVKATQSPKHATR